MRASSAMPPVQSWPSSFFACQPAMCARTTRSLRQAPGNTYITRPAIESALERKTCWADICGTFSNLGGRPLQKTFRVVT
ncbi:hypothetical protein BDZ89DRAFT_1062620 [Hymenopellis radicata]|nr:hypothetical protein BDZ89DRAFT_1062620 [Hymenopellis radicata]